MGFQLVGSFSGSSTATSADACTSVMARTGCVELAFQDEDLPVAHITFRVRV